MREISKRDEPISLAMDYSCQSFEKSRLSTQLTHDLPDILRQSPWDCMGLLCRPTCLASVNSVLLYVE
jgi:hypothetical protein